MLKKFVLACLMAAGLASAQEEMGGGGSRGGGGGRGGDMGGMGGMGGAMPRKATKTELFVDKLKLNQEQKEEAQKILSAALERLGAVRMEMDDRRAKIAGALIDGKSEADVKTLLDQYTVSYAQMMKIQADAFAKILATLKPNQTSKADQAFELLSGMFTASGARGGRGGPGGAGRGRGSER